MLGAFLFRPNLNHANPSCARSCPTSAKSDLTKFDDALQQRTRRLCMVLENVYQSRNASAVMRSCDGMGVQDVHLIEDINPWVYNRGVSKGTPSWLTLHRYTDTEDPTEACIQAYGQAGTKSLSPPPT